MNTRFIQLQFSMCKLKDPTRSPSDPLLAKTLADWIVGGEKGQSRPRQVPVHQTGSICKLFQVIEPMTPVAERRLKTCKSISYYLQRANGFSKGNLTLACRMQAESALTALPGISLQSTALKDSVPRGNYRGNSIATVTPLHTEIHKVTVSGK